MHAGKTLRRPGATPLWTAFSRPKFCGVAPGRHAGSATVFCPPAYKRTSNSERREEAILNTNRRRSDASLESTT